MCYQLWATRWNRTGKLTKRRWKMKVHTSQIQQRGKCCLRVTFLRDWEHVHLFIKIFDHEILNIVPNACLIPIKSEVILWKALSTFYLESSFSITFVLVENILLIVLLKLGMMAWQEADLNKRYYGCLWVQNPFLLTRTLCGPPWSPAMEPVRIAWGTIRF